MTTGAMCEARHTAGVLPRRRAVSRTAAVMNRRFPRRVSGISFRLLREEIRADQGSRPGAEVLRAELLPHDLLDVGVEGSPARPNDIPSSLRY